MPLYAYGTCSEMKRDARNSHECTAHVEQTVVAKYSSNTRDESLGRNLEVVAKDTIHMNINNYWCRTPLFIVVVHKRVAFSRFNSGTFGIRGSAGTWDKTVGSRLGPFLGDEY